MTATSNLRAAVQPLDEFFRRQGRPLPAFTVINAEEIPEPHRSLLVHDRDMTRTLEQFHGGEIHLRVISSYRDGDSYWRESVLEMDGSGFPVEFGAIKILLRALPEECRRLILAEHRPFGGILNAAGVRYTSRPSAYLRFITDEFIATAFGVTLGSFLFGRQNTLRAETGEPLAEIIEILPPTAP
jgi:chorismate-pyruvate lyase